MSIKRVNGVALLCAVLVLLGCVPKPSDDDKRVVLASYRTQAYLLYSDAFAASEALYAALNTLVDRPSAASLAAARQAWRAARVPYSQTEALRFGHWFVDQWEEKINRWPVDEGFIDYVDERYRASSSNAWAHANIIAAEHIDVRGRSVPLPYMVHRQLTMLEMESGVESIVASGFHAIEFMLWGQDVSSEQPLSGQRPWSDFAYGAACSDGAITGVDESHCRKRREFLLTLALQLRSTLLEMREHWSAAPGSPGSRLLAGDVDVGLGRMLLGMAAMSIEELAGERIQAALLSGSPEDEQDCFSDDTFQSLWYNALGVENVYYGRYRGSQDFTATLSLAVLASRYQPALAADLDAAFARSKQLFAEIRHRGVSGEQYFDQLIHDEPALLRTTITALQRQAQLLEALAVQLAVPLSDPALQAAY